MLETLLSYTAGSAVSMESFVLSGVLGIALGLLISFIYMYRNPRYSKNLVITLSTMPAMIAMVIGLVNDNVGAGMAVLGAFSLVRFRSAPGNAREIASIFLAMVVGLGLGMQAWLASCVFCVFIGLFMIILLQSSFGLRGERSKELRITVSEDIDYEKAFQDVFAQFTSVSELVKVRTTNLGSLFEVYYQVTLKNDISEKKFIDELRIRNGNLNIICGKISEKEEL